MFEINRIGRTLGVADAVALAENRIHNGLSALRCLMKLDRTIVTGSDAGPAGYTIVFIDRANGSGDGDGITRKQGYRPTGSPVGLINRFRNKFGIVGRTAEKNTFGAELNRSQFDMGFLKKSIRPQRNSRR